MDRHSLLINIVYKRLFAIACLIFSRGSTCVRGSPAYRGGARWSRVRPACGRKVPRASPPAGGKSRVRPRLRVECPS